MLIMTFVTKSLASIAIGVTRVVAQGCAGIIRSVKAVINRREILRLAELDDRVLKDIGLVRMDVEGALASSWLRDPSAILAARTQAASEVAAARREEGERQSQAHSPATAAPARKLGPAAVPQASLVACSA